MALHLPHPISEKRHQERPREGAENGPLPSRQTRPADHHRGDHIELEPDRAGRIPHRESREGHPAGETREKTGERVDPQLGPADPNAAEARGRLVRSDRQGVTTEE